MKNKMLKSDYLLFFLAILGILIFISFYQQLFPKAGIHLRLTKQQIENIGYQVIDELDYNVANHRKIVSFNQDPIQIKYLVQKYGDAEAISLMKNEIPAYYWIIRWELSNGLLDQIVSSDEEDVNINVDNRGDLAVH